MSLTPTPIQVNRPGGAPWRVFGCLLLLCAATWFVFGQLREADFLNFDDDILVRDNPRLEAGLSATGVRWAFTANLTHYEPYAEYWQPLTLLTRLADRQFFGLNAGSHHLVSVLLHALAGLVSFAALRALLHSDYQSFCLALLFLIHPLHVEPVAWLSARKDVLSGLFFFATIWAYAHYAARPGPARYTLMLAAFLCANMAKPMAVALPFVLLLLDFWPLRRFTLPTPLASLRPLLLEKLPLFLIALGVTVLTVLAQRAHGAVDDTSVFPLDIRLANAALALCAYLGQTLLPFGLAVHYPHRGDEINWPGALVAVVFLAGVTLLAIRAASTRPWLTVCWFFFLITILPSSGVIQIGEMARADRYVYVALTGIFLAVVRQVAEWWPDGPATSNRRWRPLFALAVAAPLLGAALLAREQTALWKDSVTLFRHAVAVTRENYIAEVNLANALAEKGERAEAAIHYREGLRIRGPALQSYLETAAQCEESGQWQQALYCYTKVLTVMPWHAQVNDRAGKLLLRMQSPDRALVRFNEILRNDRGSIPARIGVVQSLQALGRLDEARGVLQDLQKREPDRAEVRALAESFGK